MTKPGIEGGIRGVPNIPNTLAASGRWNIGDVYSSRRTAAWPIGIYPVFVGGASSTRTNSGIFSTQPARPANTQEGDVIFAFVAGANGAISPVQTGWTFVDQATLASSRMLFAVYYRVATNADPANWGWNTTTWSAAHHISYRRVDPVNPVAGIEFAGSTSFVADLPSVAATEDNLFLIGNVKNEASFGIDQSRVDDPSLIRRTGGGAGSSADARSVNHQHYETRPVFVSTGPSGVRTITQNANQRAIGRVSVLVRSQRA